MDDKNKKAIGIGLGALALVGLGIGLSKMRRGGGDSGRPTCSATQYWNGTACVDKPDDPTEPLVCGEGYHPNATNTACEQDTAVGNNTESGLPIIMNIKRATNAYGNIIPKQIDVGETFYGWVYLVGVPWSYQDDYQPFTVYSQYGVNQLAPKKNEWDFGDGTIVDLAKGGSGVHTYSDYGTYVIKNSYEDAGGNIGSISREIILTESGISGTVGYVGDGGFSNVQRWNKDTGEYEDLPLLTGFRYRSKQLTGTHVIGPAVDTSSTPHVSFDALTPWAPYSVQLNIFVPWDTSAEGWCLPTGDLANNCRMVLEDYGGIHYVASNAHLLLGAEYPELVYHKKYNSYNQIIVPSDSLYGACWFYCPLNNISRAIEDQWFIWNYIPQGVAWQEI